MDSGWFKTILAVSVLAGTNVTIACILGPKFKKDDGTWNETMKLVMYILLAFAAGVLSGDAVMHLIPHGFEKLEELERTGETHRLLGMLS